MSDETPFERVLREAIDAARLSYRKVLRPGTLNPPSDLDNARAVREWLDEAMTRLRAYVPIFETVSLCSGEPRRVQRRRVKGWRMPSGTIYCGRPTRFANPWIVEHSKVNGWTVVDPPFMAHRRRHHCSSRRVAHRLARWFFRRWIDSGFCPMPILGLAEYHLACWCALDLACHVDVLLDVANGPRAAP